MSIVTVGTVAFDAIETPFGKTDKIVGGAATYISWAASYFTKSLNVVSVIGDDFNMTELQKLKDRGVDTEGIEIKEGQILKFGKNESCFVNIPLDDIDNEQFLLTNYLGGLYLIDCSNNYPTRIKVEADKFYALN